MPVDLVRQAAFRPSSNPNIGLILELARGTQIAVLQSQLASLTASQVQVLLRTTTDRTDIYVHRNRDGTIALAIGDEPAVWPEDASWRL
jgi:2-phospho-L-lactate guanylyltransferase (CobY/MobA/RfbA family)